MLLAFSDAFNAHTGVLASPREVLSVKRIILPTASPKLLAYPVRRAQSVWFYRQRGYVMAHPRYDLECS